MYDLEHKVALVTGGGSGIGRAMAHALVGAGARVIVMGRRADALERVVDELGPAVRAFVGSVAEMSDLDRLMKELRRDYGRIDALLLNAGVSNPGALDEMSEASFDELFAVNVKGAYFTLQKALPLLSPGASVILTTSFVNQVGLPNSSAYTASKGALAAMMRALAVELIAREIRVNAVSPGFTDTPIFKTLGMDAAAIEAFMRETGETIPAGRFAAPEEIAEAALFLIHQPYIVGQEIVVDGGRVLV